MLPMIAIAGAYEDFFQAIQNNDGKAVSTLLQRGIDPNTPNPQLVPALLVAIQSKAEAAISALLKAPSLNVNAANDQDETPLMLAALNGNLALVKELVDMDAAVNKPGWTPLHYAATYGHDEIVRFLLEENAYIDAEAPNKTTPLMMAARLRLRTTAKLLVTEGADPTIVNMAGYNAAKFAREAGDVELADWLERQGTDFRVKHGLPLNP